MCLPVLLGPWAHLCFALGVHTALLFFTALTLLPACFFLSALIWHYCWQHAIVQIPFCSFSFLCFLSCINREANIGLIQCLCSFINLLLSSLPISYLRMLTESLNFWIFCTEKHFICFWMQWSLLIQLWCTCGQLKDNEYFGRHTAWSYARPVLAACTLPHHQLLQKSHKATQHWGTGQCKSMVGLHDSRTQKKNIWKLVSLLLSEEASWNEEKAGSGRGTEGIRCGKGLG